VFGSNFPKTFRLLLGFFPVLSQGLLELLMVSRLLHGREDVEDLRLGAVEVAHLIDE
jgi:hypothetical protein